MKRTPRTVRRLPLALGCVVSLTACTEPQESRATQTIVGGTSDPGDPAVVALAVRSPICGKAPEAHCTGTVIAPRVVLTAAHCLDQPIEMLEIAFGREVPNGVDALVRIIDQQTDPSDLGLVVLAADAPAAPVPLGRTPLDAPLVGASVRVVGFGLDDDGRIGVKRQGTSTVTMVTADELSLAPGPALSCGGDSGGPVLTGPPGAETLAAVTVSGDPQCAISARNLRVDAHLAFIDEQVAAAPDRMPPKERPPPDLDTDFCAESCSVDEDCPNDMRCQAWGDGHRSCALLGLEPGLFGAACADGAECESTVCATDGVAACRCFTRCGDVHGSGCALGGSGAPAPLGLLILALGFTLRARGCRRSA